jgi:hypothetical protein
MRVLGLALAGVLALTLPNVAHAVPLEGKVGQNTTGIKPGSKYGEAAVGGGIRSWSQWRGGWVPPHCVPNRDDGGWGSPHGGWGNPPGTWGAYRGGQQGPYGD